MQTAAVIKKPVFYWKPSWLSHHVFHNFGDELFPLIASRLYGKPLKTTSSLIPSPKLLAGGSVICGFARDGDTVWGAGMRVSNIFTAHQLDVRAVRGPITRQLLMHKYGIACPEIYGDPALLLPDLFPEWKPNPVPGRIGLIPHMRTRKQYKNLPRHIHLITPTRSPYKVIPEIMRCEMIISGSLHGIIVAEAFGIPARWLAEDNGEPYLKYEDYYESTGRAADPAINLVRAENLGGQEAPDTLIDKAALIASFPHDICLPAR
jgi:pyruvyltransferase